MVITMEKSEVLAALKKNLQLAKAEDGKTKAIHEAEEQKFLAKFRNGLKEAAKWDYKTAKSKDFQIQNRYSGRNLTCPTAQANSIARILEQVERDTAEKYRIADETDIEKAVFWKPKSQRLAANLCDD